VKRRFRLRRRQDFDRVMRSQRVFAGRTLVVFARPNETGRWRVGVTTSRRVRGAVERNRLRRRLREAARSSLLPAGADAGPTGYDVVLIGRPAAAELPLSALEQDTARARVRLGGGRRGEAR
jgi:ribonuclease P protein component